jgi:uncharacterized protein (TIGR00369 family)
MKDEFVDNGFCFVCGQKNTCGLKIDFHFVPESFSAWAEVVFPDHGQGWQGVVHGGVLSAALDEAMIKAAQGRSIACLTGEITVRFLKPVSTGRGYRLDGKIVEDKGKMILAESALTDGAGETVARASGKIFRVRGRAAAP